jgi:exonuclease SbcD
MIKFLHTADPHLGKIYHDQPFLEDQRYMLDQLTDILGGPDYGALLMSGDIYDRSIPSPEAVSLFSSFLGKLRLRRPDLKILILPGNHDSSSRLSFGQELFEELGIHIVTDPEKSAEPVILERDGERCAFFLLPFLAPGSLTARFTGDETLPIRSQALLAREAAARLEAARRQAAASGADYTVLGAHLFCYGGAVSDSERNFLGSAEQVGADLFSGFDYAALGHLHRFQRAGPNAWYAGSPLAYSFDEAEDEKVFLSVTLGGVEAPEKNPGELFALPGAERSCRVTPIPVRPRRRLRRLQGSFNFFFKDSVQDPGVNAAAGDYLEIVLTDKTLTENALPLLQRRFPLLLAVKQDEAFARLTASEQFRLAGPPQKHSAAEEFAAFLLDIYGAADSEKTALFEELLQELSPAQGQDQ